MLDLAQLISTAREAEMKSTAARAAARRSGHAEATPVAPLGATGVVDFGLLLPPCEGTRCEAYASLPSAEQAGVRDGGGIGEVSETERETEVRDSDRLGTWHVPLAERVPHNCPSTATHPPQECRTTAAQVPRLRR